jgi:predicted butyrate kinase (DUF1464 family)
VAPTALRAKVASTELMNQLTRRADYNRWFSPAVIRRNGLP